MKRIWFTQMKQFDYMPLRAGLKQITPEELEEYWVDKRSAYSTPANPPYTTFERMIVYGTQLCPKNMTTRTHPLRGEYVVVEGSRYAARPVTPEICFQVEKTAELDLRLQAMKLWSQDGWVWTPVTDEFAEQDLGIQGSTFAELREVLLGLNPKTTLETPFYVNHLAPVKSDAKV